MMQSRFSPDVLNDLVYLAQIPTDSFRELLSEMERKLTTSLSIDEEIDKIVQDAPILASRTSTERSSISEALMGAHYLRLSAGNTDEELLKDLEGAFSESGLASVEAKDLAVLIDNIRHLLGIKVLRASAKAWSLLGDRDRLYLSSRILTDIRPVFDGEIGNPLLASLVIHSLKISMSVDGRQQSVYISADSDDLRQLQETINRALDKARFVVKQLLNPPTGNFGKTLNLDGLNE